MGVSVLSYGCLLYTSPYLIKKFEREISSQIVCSAVSYTHLDVYKRQIHVIDGLPLLLLPGRVYSITLLGNLSCAILFVSPYDYNFFVSIKSTIEFSTFILSLRTSFLLFSRHVIMEEYLKHFLEADYTEMEAKEQAGFRVGRSTVDLSLIHIFI